MTVCIKALAASPEVRERLRALGLAEKQELKLLSSRESNFVCQVCDARLDLNAELAEAIMVELPLPLRELQNFVEGVSKAQDKTHPDSPPRSLFGRGARGHQHFGLAGTNRRW